MVDLILEDEANRINKYTGPDYRAEVVGEEIKIILSDEMGEFESPRFSCDQAGVMVAVMLNVMKNHAP